LNRLESGGAEHTIVVFSRSLDKPGRRPAVRAGTRIPLSREPCGRCRTGSTGLVRRKRLDTISIKKHLEQDSDQRLASIEAAYRSALIAMGRGAMCGHPATSCELQQGLNEVESRSLEKPGPDTILEAKGEVSWLLDHWGLQTAKHLRQMAEEVKSLLVAVAGTADAVGERDQRCTEKLKELTSRLERIAKLDDMRRMRQSILESAAELKRCVREIVEKGAQTNTAFKTQIKTYEDKLEESEQRIRRDGLTGLFNRNGMERILNHRIEDQLPFSLVMVDLDDFDRVNDQYGRLVGDELLKQFAEELKAASRTADILGRWGGDEFVLILEGHLGDAAALVERMKRLATGEYSITISNKKSKLLL
jgi:diguanylate cyclase (GGDEF)-like protein